MDERAALFAAVLNTPADDTARLVLADWLQEHDEDAFGRFVRAGVVASWYSGAEVIDEPEYYAALRTIAQLAAAGHPAMWLAAVGVGPFPLAPGRWAWDSASDRVTLLLGTSAGTYQRGLLTELELALTEWYAIAPAALTAWPLERVRASDVPGLSFEIDRLTDGWRITGRVRMPRRNVPLTGYTIPAAIAPGAVLTQSSAEWAADQLFTDRAALVEGAARECQAIVDDLKAAAGDRWPRPPRRRR